MNIVGFLQIHDPHVSCAKHINDLFYDKKIANENS